MRSAPLFAVTGLLALAPPAAADLFAPARSLPAGGSATDVTVADLNRDGDPDLIVATRFGSGSKVLLGGAGGGFATPGISVPVDAFAATAADLNGDGDEDLVLADHAAELTIALRQDDGTFAAPDDIAPIFSTALGVGDFNGDGDPDLAMPTDNLVRPGLALFIGDAGAAFGLPTPVFPTAAFPVDVSVADLDRDGDDDAAVAAFSDAVSVLLNSGDGSLGPAVSYPAGASPAALATGDFDGDGFPDLAVANRDGGDVSVLRGGPGGAFTAAGAHSVGSGPNAIAAGDLDADGDLDLAVANADDGAVSVLLGRAGSGFAAGGTFPVGADPGGVALADFDRDGQLDLAAANRQSNNVSVLLNATSPAIATDVASLGFPPQTHGTISPPRTVTVRSAGDRALRVNGVTTGDDFLVASDTCTGRVIAPGGACAIAVRFAPVAEGPRSASLQIASDAGVRSVALDGVGAAPTAASIRPLLAAVFAVDRQSARAGRRLRLRYVSTIDALVTVQLRRGRRVVRRFTATAVAGRNTLTLRVPARRGRYTLALTAVAGDQRVTDAARLTVLRRRA